MIIGIWILEGLALILGIICIFKSFTVEAISDLKVAMMFAATAISCLLVSLFISQWIIR